MNFSPLIDRTLVSSTVALYMHRFLENSLAPAFAKRVLGISAWSQIIVGGSNFGEVRQFGPTLRRT